MTVDGLNVGVVGDGDMIGLDADDFAELCVDCIDGLRTLSSS